MTKIAIETSSYIVRLGLSEILQEHDVYDYYELNNLRKIDLLLFEKEELRKENISKIRILRDEEVLINSAYSIISLNSSKEEILKCIDKTLKNNIYIEEKLEKIKREKLKHFKVLDKLSKRERFLIEEIIKGRSNREISQTIYISEKTVKNNLTELYKKLDVRGRDELRTSYSSLIIYKDEIN